MSQDHDAKPKGADPQPMQAMQAMQGGAQAAMQKQAVSELGAKPIQAKAAGPSARQQSLGEIGAVVQRRAKGGAEKSDDVQQTARAGVAGPGAALPHAGKIQQSFGRHNVSNVRAHVGGDAAAASGALGAQAYATGDKIAFGQQPDLHTAAHEAAHTVQQRAGKVNAAGLTAGNDAHEQQADKVADKVVAGQSAESALDQMTGGGAAAADSGGGDAAAPGGSAPATGDIVQRKLVDDVKAPALAPVQHNLKSSSYGSQNPEPGLELFSGPKQATVKHRPSGDHGSDLGRATGELGRPDNGTAESWWESAIPERYPEIMSKRGFEIYMGSWTSNEAKDSPEPLKTYFHNALYPSDPGGPWTMNASSTYHRNGADDRFTLWNGSGIGINILGGSITGSQKLETQHDGALFGKWTEKIVSKPFEQILGHTLETQGFVEALKPTGVEGLSAWYEKGRKGIFGGKTARAWLDATYADDELQKGALRSMQLLHRSGVSQANVDMDAIVDAMRGIIADKNTDATRRTVFENRILDSGVANNVKVAETAVPDDADKNKDTSDANFDRMRIAGKVIARRELVPLLQYSFDPIAYAKAYPVKKGKTLSDDMTTMVIQNAESMRVQSLAFLQSGLSAATLDPADPSAKKLGINPDSNENALGSARLGAVEAIREATEGMPIGGKSSTTHIGAHLSLLSAHATYAATGKHIDKAIATSANTGASDNLKKIWLDEKAISKAGGELDAVGGSEEDKVRGRHLTSFANLIGDYARTQDLAELRKSVNDVIMEVSKDGGTKAIQGVAYAQALSAKTEANLAYTTAHERYAADFIENLNGKFDEKSGGSKWVGSGQMIANAGKEGIDLVVAWKGLTGGATMLGPAVGVGLAVIDGILTVHDWWAKAKLAKAKAKMTSEFKSFMDQGEKQTLAKIHSQTEAEVKVAAAGEVRPTEGMKAYAGELAAGKNGTPPKPVPLSKLSSAQLDELHQEMLTNPGEPHSTLFQTYSQAIALKGNQLWKKFEAEIDGMSGTWKP